MYRCSCLGVQAAPPTQYVINNHGALTQTHVPIRCRRSHLPRCLSPRAAVPCGSCSCSCHPLCVVTPQRILLHNDASASPHRHSCRCSRPHDRTVPGADHGLSAVSVPPAARTPSAVTPRSSRPLHAKQETVYWHAPIDLRVASRQSSL